MYIKSLIKSVLMLWSSILHRNKRSKILYYHDIYTEHNYKALDGDIFMGTALSVFEKHVKVIRREGFEIVNQITKKQGQVAIMLDDGFRGIYENRKWFYDNKVFPTVFLVVEYIGKEGMLTLEEILELQSHGFRFECHSWSHCILTKWSDNDLKRELVDSKNKLSTLLGREVNEICMPVGYYSDHLLEAIKNAGYTRAYSSIPGNFDDMVVDGVVRRNICQYSTPFEVKLILRGGNEVIKRHYQKMHHVNHGFDID